MNLSLTLCVLLIIFNNTKPVMTSPQVFNSSIEEFCTYNFPHEKSLQLPSKTWTIINENFKLYFNLCPNLRSNTPCHNKISSCLIKNNRNFDVGSTFVPKSQGFALHSLNGATCVKNPKQNYSLTIDLKCSDFAPSQPRLIRQNGCNFEIEMMHPECRPYCTGLLEGGHLLDLRNFTKEIKVKSDNREFSLTLCGSSTKCGNTDVSTCEIFNNSIIPLAFSDSQVIHYDINKNELMIKGRYKSKGVTRKLEVTLKCSWESELSSAIYKKPSTQGQRYHFEIESSYGCVKLPSQYSVIGNDNSRYNLSGLYKSDNWEVHGAPGRKITINICGPLKFSAEKNICSDQFSQVCEVSNNNYINRGSILQMLEPNDSDIKAVFGSGSICTDKNGTTTHRYSTEILFQCSRKEEGPLYKNYTECVTFLTWKTPFACPTDYYVGDDCLVVDRLGNRNLQKIHSNKDTTIPFKQTNMILDYNLCGPLHTSCDSYNNVSFCLRRRDKNDLILGWETRKLISDRGVLKLEMQGNWCATGSKVSTVTITFICNYQTSPPPPTLQTTSSKCHYTMTVFTQLACLADNNFVSCNYTNGNNFFDLSPLTSKNSSYVIEDEANIKYIINVCGPVVSQYDALCRGNSMICRRNNTEIDFKKRYVSLGGVSKPELINGTLIIESSIGDYCGFGHYKSRIIFECSLLEKSPRIWKKERCDYTFLWKTPLACPSETCLIPNSTIDLTHLKKKSLKVNIGNTTNYEFSLCSNRFEECTNKICITKPLKRKLVYVKETPAIQLELGNDCVSSEKKFSDVQFQLVCDNIANNDHFESLPVENCTLPIILKTSLVCKNVPFVNGGENNKYSSTTEPIKITVETNRSENTPESLNCSISNEIRADNFNLSRIKVSQVNFGNNVYTVSFGGESKKCTGLLCRNGFTILPFSDKCPEVAYNYSESSLKLQFLQQTPCRDGFYNFEMVLRCRGTATQLKILQEQMCSLTMLYDLPQTCKLFKVAPGVASVSLVIVFGIGIVLVVTVLIVILLRKWRSRQCEEWPPLLLNSYCRNTQE